MLHYKLLTPGPLTTTETVKEQMLVDHCTWDEDYKKITRAIRQRLLELAQVSEPDYTAVLMQGSGTFGVESVLTSVIGQEDVLLIAANGAYGKRMAEIAEHAGISYLFYEEPYDRMPSAETVRTLLQANPEVTHVSMVHSETTSGILNDIAAVSAVVKEAGCTMIVDAMSSFGGVQIPMGEWGIDFLVSSANKCIQGVPGFSFILCRTDKLIESKGKARSLSLDLYDQWETMQRDGKWRFTSPTHVVLAFWQALQELEAEGGISARYARYRNNQKFLTKHLQELGFRPFLSKELQGPIITTFYYPEELSVDFAEMYHFIKERGYAIYPGKLTDAETFRIGHIGEIYETDMEKLWKIMKEYVEVKRNEI